MLWQYLRTKVRDSILAGVNDAVTEIEGAGNGELTEAAGLLRARLQPALPGPAAEAGHGGNGDSNGEPPNAVATGKRKR